MPFQVEIGESERVLGMDKTEWWQQQDELPGILLWSIEGLSRLREQGRFSDSSVCKEAIAEYRDDTNPVRTFLCENYRNENDGKVETADVYDKYCKWCDANGFRRMNDRTFGKEVRRVFKIKKVRTGSRNDRRYVYLGLCEGEAL